MDQLITIIPYFNYFKNPYLEANLYRVLEKLERQGVPVFLAEAVLENQDFVLKPGPNTLQCRSRSVLWQKERLINLGIDRVIGKYQTIVWLDGDILMPDGWVEMVLERLEKRPLVQLYKQVDYLTQDGLIDMSVASFAHTFRQSNFEKVLNQAKSGGPGMGWAARSELFETGVRIYDRHVTSGSDTMMAISLAQLRPLCILALRANPHRYSLLLNGATSRHHRKWDQEFVSRLDQISSMPGPDGWLDNLPLVVHHLFHGDYKKRNYMERHWVLFENEFDPEEDLTVNEDGLLEWNSNKPELHKKLKLMFMRLSGKVAF